MLLFLSCIVILAKIFHGCHAQVYSQPEQVHLSMTSDPGEMMITWVTFDSTNQSIVEYAPGSAPPFTLKAYGQQQLFIDGGSSKRKLYMHRVVLQGLKPGALYIYHVGSVFGWSEVFTFNAIKSGSNWSPRFAVYGDLGNKNARSLAFIQEEVQNKKLDFILHIGDFAYDMDTNNAEYGDQFMRQIEPVAAYIPYMTCAGNHEQAYNFSNYKARFTMPGGDGYGQYFSFNVGPIHIISISTEFYYFINYGWKQIENQFEWLKKDLQEANKPENRAVHPWIIVVGHRPMYCSNSDDREHCPNVNNLVRTGIPIPETNTTYMFGLEDLFYNNGVDLIFGAHEHSYERMWPVYNRQVCNGTEDPKNPYINPPGPVHVVTGSGGCQEGQDPFYRIPFKWSAAHSDDYGYTVMEVLNSTHMTLQQVSADKGGSIIDTMTYVRSKHGAGNFDCRSKSKTLMKPVGEEQIPEKYRQHPRALRTRTRFSKDGL